MGFNPVKDHAADREICRGEAFGQIFWTFCKDSAPNASPLPIVPPIAKILHTQNLPFTDDEYRFGFPKFTIHIAFCQSFSIDIIESVITTINVENGNFKCIHGSLEDV
jgi:hypothetical protein